MSVTVAAAAKKIAVYLATDKRTWKVVGTIIGIAIAIVLLPVMLLLAMENQLSCAVTLSLDCCGFVLCRCGAQLARVSVVLSANNIGIFVGDSYVVYAKSIAEGVVKESVSEGNWTAWFEIPWIQYGEEKSFSNDIQFEEYDPAVKNNLDLVQWAIQAHENGWGYVYGTYGNVLTESLLQDRASVFGGQVTSYMDFIRSNWMGKRTSDCVGLIKGYGWYDSVSGEIVVGSNGMMDVTANGMFEAATVKGTIDTIPEVPGLAVWHQGHIGIYIGNGEVVEAMNTTRGVTRTKLAGRSWTHWLQIPYISYVEEKENESTLEK